MASQKSKKFFLFAFVKNGDILITAKGKKKKPIFKFLVQPVS